MPLLDSHFAPSGPGAVSAVAVDGCEPLISCTGFSDIEQGTRIDRNTLFELASVTKVFTATAALRLVEQGRLNLDTDVSACLPQCDRPAEGRAITVQDLLSHTSGLTDYLEMGVFTPPARMTARSVMRRLGNWSRKARPGLAHVYSNTNYVLLAALIEKASGRSYAQFLTEELFRPLGMNSTFVLAADRRNVPMIARGYVNVGFGLPAFQPFHSTPIDTVGDGGVVSAIDDLLRWQEAFWAGRVLGEDMLDLMCAPGRLDSGEAFDYGLGLQVQRVGGETWCGHGGAWTNATAILGRYLEARTSVIVLSNEFAAPIERIMQRIFATAVSRTNTFRGI